MGERATPDLVYILGAGRSGSTVLGIVLGNLPGVFYGGELFAWPHFRGVPITDDPAVARFWSDFADRLPADAVHHTDDYYYGLERWSALLRPRFWTDRGLRRRHRAHTTALFPALRAATGATTIVDSSHFPLRLGALRRHGHRLAIVHLVRDPRDVVRALGRSEQRRAPMHPVAAAVYCWVTALMSGYQYVRGRGLPRVTVRYEDLVDSPDATTRRLCEAVGLEYRAPDFDHLVTGPLFNGNRLRHSPEISLRPAARTRPRAAGMLRVADLAVWPLRRWYGYD